MGCSCFSPIRWSKHIKAPPSFSHNYHPPPHHHHHQQHYHTLSSHTHTCIRPQLVRRPPTASSSLILQVLKNHTLASCAQRPDKPTLIHEFQGGFMWDPQLRPLRPGASLAGTFTHLSMTVFVGRSRRPPQLATDTSACLLFWRQTMLVDCFCLSILTVRRVPAGHTNLPMSW